MTLEVVHVIRNGPIVTLDHLPFLGSSELQNITDLPLEIRLPSSLFTSSDSDGFTFEGHTSWSCGGTVRGLQAQCTALCMIHGLVKNEF